MACNASIRRIGEVGVDAGLLMVGDPCYFWPHETDGKTTATESIPTWTDVCEALNGGITEDKSLALSRKNGYQLNYKKGHAGLGVVVQTTHGDGCYSVYLEVENGKRRLVVELD